MTIAEMFLLQKISSRYVKFQSWKNRVTPQEMQRRSLAGVFADDSSLNNVKMDCVPYQLGCRMQQNFVEVARCNNPSNFNGVYCPVNLEVRSRGI